MKLAVIVVFLLLTVGSALVSWWLSQRKQQRDADILERSIAEGLSEPPSLHPIIDPHACIGTAACVAACPEGGILGIVNGRAALIEPSRCIGHGACFAACPTHAIELVFGTERRGIEIPHVKSDFETNVHGLYIAGELGGMGLVRNAMSQGAKALEAIASGLAAGPKHDLEFDVAIIGAGPAGIAASLAAKRAGLRTVTLEQDAIGGTVYHYPREKMVITRPIDVPGYGRIEAREIQKEELLRIWQDVIRTTGIEIRVRERVKTVVPVNGGFAIETASGRYRAARTILAGRTAAALRARRRLDHAVCARVGGDPTVGPSGRTGRGLRPRLRALRAPGAGRGGRAGAETLSPVREWDARSGRSRRPLARGAERRRIGPAELWRERDPRRGGKPARPPAARAIGAGSGGFPRERPDVDGLAGRRTAGRCDCRR